MDRTVWGGEEAAVWSYFPCGGSARKIKLPATWINFFKIGITWPKIGVRGSSEYPLKAEILSFLMVLMVWDLFPWGKKI